MAGVVFITVGPPGTGKSFERGGRWMAEEFLPYNKGTHYSNLPIKPEAMAKYVKAKHGVDVGDRIQAIPQDVLDSWARFESGPWDYFTDERFGEGGLAGAHIAIDECHYYFPFGRGCPKEHRVALQNWLGTIRHIGVTVEFMTQAHGKVAKEIVDHCEHRITLASASEYSLPLIGLRYGDLYQILARFTGKLIRVTHVTEEQLKGRKWEKVRSRLISLREPYFSLYDSYNATEDGQAGARPQAEWERLEGFRFWRWLWGRYWFSVLLRVFIVGVVVFGLWGLKSGFFLERYLGVLTPAKVERSERAKSTRNGSAVQTDQRFPSVPSTSPPAAAPPEPPAGPTLGGVTERFATFDGWAVRVGENIDPADLSSPLLLSCNAVRGSVRLSGGRRVAIGGRVLEDAETKAAELRPMEDVSDAFAKLLQRERAAGGGAAAHPAGRDVPAGRGQPAGD